MNTINDTFFETITKDSFGPLIHKIDHSIYLKHNTMLKDYGITLQQSMVLCFLYYNRNNESINQKAIEEHMELTGPSVSSLTQNMVKNGIILRLQDENDARHCRFELTEKGMELHEISSDIFMKINAILNKNMSEDEIETLKRLLTKVVKNIEEE